MESYYIARRTLRRAMLRTKIPPCLLIFCTCFALCAVFKNPLGPSRHLFQLVFMESLILGLLCAPAFHFPHTFEGFKGRGNKNKKNYNGYESTKVQALVSHYSSALVLPRNRNKACKSWRSLTIHLPVIMPHPVSDRYTTYQ